MAFFFFLVGGGDDRVVEWENGQLMWGNKSIMYKSIFLSLKKNSKNPKGKCDDHWNLLQMNPIKETEDGDKSDK